MSISGTYWPAKDEEAQEYRQAFIELKTQVRFVFIVERTFAGMDWMDIQKYIKSHLGLSPEETKVLESVHNSDGG